MFEEKNTFSSEIFFFDEKNPKFRYLRFSIFWLKKIPLDFFLIEKIISDEKKYFSLKTHILSKIHAKYEPLTPETPKVRAKSRFRIIIIFRGAFFLQEPGNP